MKTIASVFIATGLLISLTSGTPASTTPYQPSTISVQQTNAAFFQRFIVHRQQNDAALQWCMSSNEGVAGFVVERSYNGVYFDYVGDAEVTTSQWNRYRDATVIPGNVYYRVVCIMEDGTTVTSDVEMIRIVRHG